MKKRTDDATSDRIKDAIATAEVVFSLGQSEAQAIVGEMVGAKARTDFARGLCTAMLAALWAKSAQACGCTWAVREPVVAPLKRFTGLVDRLSGALVVLPKTRAGFLAGQIYTALLPDNVRKTLGAFYTPPPLVDRLLELVTFSGFDWSRGRIIDPACGGAAFLASVAPKLVEVSRSKSFSAVLQDIESRLVGMEVDPFAAWMSMVLLDLTLIDLTTAVKRPLKPLVIACDALETSVDRLGEFDLVIGNPPYGRVSLKPLQRERFRESLFGHANLYGLFTELAVRLTKTGGLIAYVTPTSFLGGEYFKNLRGFLSKLAPLQRLDFIRDREGIFNGVLQETMLAVFAREMPNRQSTVHVSVLHPDEPTQPVNVECLGEVLLNGVEGRPWLLPRSRGQTPLVRQFNAMPHRLSDFDFGISTGQLVWNRHKDQLRSTYDSGCYPIVWAEAVTSDGKFQFQAARRTHLPYLKLKSRQDWLINQEPCILVQRTTAKEQKRRLIAAVIPNSFVLEYPGFVVENHLNMIYSLSRRPRIALRTLVTLLNSETLDQAFRCINGSVAVSAYELNSLPLPNPDQMRRLQHLVISGAAPVDIEKAIAVFYRAEIELNAITPTSYSSTNHRKVVA